MQSENEMGEYIGDGDIRATLNESALGSITMTNTTHERRLCYIEGRIDGGDWQVITEVPIKPNQSLVSGARTRHDEYRVRSTSPEASQSDDRGSMPTLDGAAMQDALDQFIDTLVADIDPGNVALDGSTDPIIKATKDYFADNLSMQSGPRLDAYQMQIDESVVDDIQEVVEWANEAASRFSHYAHRINEKCAERGTIARLTGEMWSEETNAEDMYERAVDARQTFDDRLADRMGSEMLKGLKKAQAHVQRVDVDARATTSGRLTGANGGKPACEADPFALGSSGGVEGGESGDVADDDGCPACESKYTCRNHKSSGFIMTNAEYLDERYDDHEYVPDCHVDGRPCYVVEGKAGVECHFELNPDAGTFDAMIRGGDPGIEPGEWIAGAPFDCIESACRAADEAVREHKETGGTTPDMGQCHACGDDLAPSHSPSSGDMVEGPHYWAGCACGHRTVWHEQQVDGDEVVCDQEHCDTCGTMDHGEPDDPLQADSERFERTLAGTDKPSGYDMDDACPECGGSGEIELFTSVDECSKCDGEGTV